MRVNNEVILASTAISGTNTVTSTAFNVQHAAGFAIQLVSTSTATGEAKLQGSCDPIDSTPSNWSDLPDSGETANIDITAAGTKLWNVSNTLFSWVRFSYTNATNSGTLAGRISTKGF